MVGTTKRSIATTPSAWLRRNVFHPCEGGPLLRAIYFVWTGRAVQAGCDDLEIIGLAHLYSAHCRERFLLPGHHGYPRASDLIRDKALEGRKYIKITDATVRPFLHLLNPTRRPRQESFGFCRR